jgi:hypothetical protein
MCIAVNVATSSCAAEEGIVVSNKRVAARLQKNLDIRLLLCDLRACSEGASHDGASDGPGQHWVPESYGEASYFTGWDILPIRSRGGRADDGSAGTKSLDPFEYTPLAKDTPYFVDVIEGLECQIKSVRLSCLRPGGEIFEHKDEGISFEEGDVRLHIPIVTNDQVVFRLGGELQKWGAGELWYGDFSEMHSVANPAAQARIHLLIDCLMSPALCALFPDDFLRSRGKPILRSPIDASGKHDLRRYEFDFAIKQAECDQMLLEQKVPPMILAAMRQAFAGKLSIRALGGELKILVDEQPRFTLDPQSHARLDVRDSPASIDLEFEEGSPIGGQLVIRLGEMNAMIPLARV